jgi:DNA-binding winged helix-turn-helix (wHTH) protein
LGWHSRGNDEERDASTSGLQSNPEPAVSLRFAKCELDLEARRLFRAGHEVHLSPKAFQLLKVLVECRPRALAKSELLDRVWPGVFVSEASLVRVVNEIREAIGDHARRGRLVRTVHAFGYAFTAEVQGASQQTSIRATDRRALCWLITGTREIPLYEGEQIVGRETDTNIRLDSTKVSRHHARFMVSGTRVTVEDLDSKNGTFVHGVRVDGETVLEPGDSVRIGTETFTLWVDQSSRPTETEVASRVSAEPDRRRPPGI